MAVIITSLLIIGLVLLIVEVIFIPGTTVVGVLGLVFSAVGVLISYKHYGDEVGFYILLSALLATAVTLFYSFKSGAWNKFALKSQLKGRVNEGYVNNLNLGDEGIAVSALRPVGKALFNDRTIEVRSLGQYIAANKKIRIVQIDNQQVFVEESENNITN